MRRTLKEQGSGSRPWKPWEKLRQSGNISVSHLCMSINTESIKQSPLLYLSGSIFPSPLFSAPSILHYNLKEPYDLLQSTEFLWIQAMIFSSLPAYLDTTSNWNQSHQVIGSSSGNSSLIPSLQASQPHGGGGAAVVRSGSMVERARLANIPMPESALRCPRCDSTNTKFCYFNNYSLSQPRHFCKSCRRYWTKGGALRNVPVGGGCRRNKRSKTNASRAQTRSERPNTATASGSLPANTTGGGGNGGLTPQLPPLRFIPQLSENFNTAHEMVGSDLLNGGSLAPLFSCSDGSLEQWRFHQAPQLSFMDPSPEFQHGEPPFIVADMLQPTKHSERFFPQGESVKTEENPQVNPPRQAMGAKLHGNDHDWSNAPSSWTEFCSPSTTTNRM